MVANMAEAPDPNVKRLELLEQEITCAVCQLHYQGAKLLPCNHYYCATCIESLANLLSGRSFPCPECRKDTTLPSGGIEQLQSAFFVERLKDLYTKMAKIEGKEEAVCESCSLRGKAVSFCRQCTAFLCAHCVEQHLTLLVFKGHNVKYIKDLKFGGDAGVCLKKTPPLKCPKHDEPMKIFCFDCNCLICGDCTVIEHHGHDYYFLKKCAAEARKNLNDSLAPLQEIQSNISDADNNLARTEVQVSNQENQVHQSVKQSFTQVRAIIEQRETELVKKLLTLSQEKKDVLRAQRKELQMAQTEIQSLMEFVKQNVENTSDEDVMGISTQLQTKVGEEKKRQQQLSLEPATIANLTYYPPSLSNISKQLGEVFEKKIATQKPKKNSRSVTKNVLHFH